MKYCSKCGNQIMDDAVICVHCGCAVDAGRSVAVSGGDAPNTGMAVIGFLIPLAGLIIYLINKDTKPKMAESAGKGALIGFIVGLVLSIIYGAVVGSMLGSMF